MPAFACIEERTEDIDDFVAVLVAIAKKGLGGWGSLHEVDIVEVTNETTLGLYRLFVDSRNQSSRLNLDSD
jgi:hypothetical protein